MARLSGSVLGNLSGRLGNLSARTVYGETILSARPSSFDVSYSPACVAARQKFAVTCKFSKSILSNSSLLQLWEKVKLPGMSIHNTVFKQNYPFSSSEKPTLSNIVTPGGFSLPVTSAVLSPTQLSLSMEEISSVTTISSDDENFLVFGIVAYHNPISPEDEEYRLITFIFNAVKFRL